MAKLVYDLAEIPLNARKNEMKASKVVAQKEPEKELQLVAFNF